MKIENDFKEALSQLPSKEKDKLILRLLRKDNILAQRLYFELIESNSMDERRTDLEFEIKERSEYFKKSYSSPGYLMMDMRYLSGEITHHVKVTKDKFGEASLNLLMLIKVLEGNNNNLKKAGYSQAYKCNIYIISRTFKILMLINNLHEDYYMDFESDIKKLGTLISDNDSLMNTAIKNGLDVNWLLSGSIPENITKIHKNIRDQGFLR